ncbi:MAG: glycosyltransferase family 2 protein, partial [Chloroflexi bacterium]|nr:glycosyltransferase family 2 protein [Chloroflexota bacterium]
MAREPRISEVTVAESDMTFGATAPEVSVVIPTRARPELLTRAIRSVSEQTFRDFEVIVVIDGPDSRTEAMLSGIDQPRVRVVVNPEPVGGGEARNIGVRASTGRWIAFLDDDDEWMPHKLERQLNDLRPAADERVVGMSQLITRSPAGDYIGPKRAPRRGEPFSDYLFVRSGWFKGGGRVQTSTLLVPRDVMIEIPFDPGLPRYQETDWILRVAASGARIMMTMEPLSIWYVEDGRATITSSFAGDWRFALDWIRERRHLMTSRAYGSLMLIRVGGLA